MEPKTSSIESTTDNVTVDTTTDTSEEVRRHAFGEWGSVTLDGTTRWKITVSGVELLSSFTLTDSGKTYDMPEGKQLGITTTKMRNTSSSLDSWEDTHQFVVMLPDDSVIEPESYFEHPEFTDVVFAKNLEAVSRLGQYRAEGYTVSPGETGTLQWVTVLPQNVSIESLRIGFDPHPESTKYSLRWLPGKS